MVEFSIFLWYPGKFWIFLDIFFLGYSNSLICISSSIIDPIFFSSRVSFGIWDWIRREKSALCSWTEPGTFFGGGNFE